MLPEGWTIIKLGGTVSALLMMGGLLWAAGDKTGYRPVIKAEFMTVEQQLEQMSKSVLLLQFQYLMAKKESGGGLTFDEQQQLCRISYALGFVGVPGCPT